jgi:hypothetical protein
MTAYLLGHRYLIEAAIFLIMAVVAWRRGAGPERACAAVPLGMYLGDMAYHAIFGAAHFAQIDLGHLAIDALAEAAYMAIALQANRIYPIWLAGSQLIALVSHFSRGLSPAIGMRAYAILIMGPIYLQIGIQLWGLIAHLRRVKRTGSYRSWRSSSSPSRKPAPAI